MFMDKLRSAGIGSLLWLRTSFPSLGFIQGVIATIAVGGWLMWGYLSMHNQMDSQRDQITRLQTDVARVISDEQLTRNQMHDLNVDVHATLDAVLSKIESMSKRK